MKQYDAIIIGTGQSGPSLAGVLTSRGQKVAIAEGHLIGGSCVNYGCIPTKTIIASARVAYLAGRGAEYGVNTGPVSVDLRKVMARKDQRVHSAHSGVEQRLETMDRLHLYRVYAHFEGTENGMHRVRMGDEVVEAPHVYINTGTRPIYPDIPGLKDVPTLTNEELLQVESAPEHLLILGGGYISLEFGQAFQRFGSQVTIIEKHPILLHKEDDDIRAEVMNILENEGLNILLGHETFSASQGSSGKIILTLEDGDGNPKTIEGTHLLVAVGRQPNSDKLNLDAVGVETNDGGYIVTDAYLETNVKGIWAMGDVNGRGAFTHTSYQDYEIVRDNLDGSTRKVTDRIMAYAMYIDPPLGRVGMSEQEARESGRKVLMATKPMNEVSRALEQGETQGMIKILVNAESEQIIGAAVLGFHGDDVIQILSYFMHTGASYKVMQNALPIHPTVGEFLPTILGELKPLE